jgi:hypothetical protein
MTDFLRYRPVLGGFIGAPGINTFNGEMDVIPQASDAQAWATAVRAVYNALSNYLANGVTVTFPGEVTAHNEATGELTAVYGVTPPAVITGSASAIESQESRATQLVVALATDQIRDGRRLAGRIFIGPVGGGALGSDGQVTSSCRTAVQSAFSGVLDSPGPELVVYGPPKESGPNSGSPGLKGTVTSVTVRTVPGTLRSRKN